jgi:hypothetical protein
VKVKDFYLENRGIVCLRKLSTLIYQTKRCHKREDQNMNLHLCGNLKHLIYVVASRSFNEILEIHIFWLREAPSKGDAGNSNYPPRVWASGCGTIASLTR